MKPAIFTLLIALPIVALAPASTAHASPHSPSPTLNVASGAIGVAVRAVHQKVSLKLQSVHTERAKPRPALAKAQPKGSSWGNTYPWGWCTWGAAQLALDNVNGLHNAADWFANAKARGLPVGYTPRVGATVTFQPGVQGAGGLGHVAHVIAVYSNGSFLIKEMNFYGYGGGFGLWSTRIVHTGPGVGFIY